MYQIAEMTHQEKIKMYQKLKKREIIEMLINCNNVLDSIAPIIKINSSEKPKRSEGK